MESSTLVCLFGGPVPAGLVGVRVPAAQRWLGVGSSALLGPEGSAAWLVLLLLSFVACLPVGGGVVLVGLLFELCIVDASIFVAIVVVLCV